MANRYVFEKSGFSQWRNTTGGTAGWSQPAGPPTDDPGRNVSHDMDPLEHFFWAAANPDGTETTVSRWAISNLGVWAISASENLADMESPSIVGLSFGAASLCYVESGTVKRCLYDAARGKLNVATVGTGELVDHCFDDDGRIIAVVWDTTWKVSVGTLGSDGVTYSFSTPTTMGLTATKARGSIKALPHGKLSFLYVNSTTVNHVTCPKQPSTGSGTYS